MATTLSIGGSQTQQSEEPQQSQYDQEFKTTIEKASQGRNVLTIQLFKPEGRSLGFSVVGLRSEHKGELGIYVQEIQVDKLEKYESIFHFYLNAHMFRKYR